MIQDILAKNFNIKNAEIKKLVGEVNKNYLVTNGKVKYILKESVFSEEELDFSIDECDILEHLSIKFSGYFQEPVKSSANNYLVIVPENQKIYRLFRYIEGELFHEVRHTDSLLNSFGKLLAEMNQALMDKRFLSIMSRRYDWDILQFDLNIQNIRYIEDISDRRLVEYFHMQFQEIVRPLIPKLRQSIIHGDANDYNVLVKNNRVCGIIDFGDCVYSLLINELAVAITYSLLNKENLLESATEIIQGYANKLPLKEEEADILYYLIAARLSISLCHSANGKHENPENKYLTISEKPVLNLLREWITINPIKAANEFRKAANLPQIIIDTTNSDIENRWKVISKSFSLSYNKPIKMEKAAFQYMYDNLGNTYLDLRNNIPHVGHCHPKVIKAGQAAMAKLNTNTRYLYDEIHQYSGNVLSKFPSKLNKIFFVNSGSAASDLALRLAKAHTERSKMMVMEYGYHGNTTAAIDISSYKFSGMGGKGIPNETFIAPIPISTQKLTKQEKEAINRNSILSYLEILEFEKTKIAGFITEPIVSAAGQIVIEKSYLQEIYSFIRTNGGVCISDEVQTGFGRLGKYYWGFEYSGFVPDIVILGKPIGNGHPMAAVVCTSEIADSFNNGMEFFSSFGGNPVSCSIGQAVLEVIEEENLAENARNVGEYLISEFKELREEFPYLGEIRGMGLSLGIEIVKDTYSFEPNSWLALKIVQELRNKNILVGTDGPFNNVFKLKPPLCFTTSNAKHFINEFKRILAALK